MEEGFGSKCDKSSILESTSYIFRQLKITTTILFGELKISFELQILIWDYPWISP